MTFDSKAVGQRGYPLRFSLEKAQMDKVNELIAAALASGVDCGAGTVLRTLLELASPTSDFLGRMRLGGDIDRALRKNREEERETVIFNLEPQQDEKLNLLLASARGNGVKGAASTVIRALVEMAEPSHDFLSVGKLVKEREMKLRKARRETKPRGKSTKTP